MLNRQEESAAFDWFVRELCSDFNGSETGGVRAAVRNALKGGHPRSKHLCKPPPGVPIESGDWAWGLGDDIVFDEPAGLVGACKRIAAHPRYVYRTYEGEHRIHLQGFPVGKLPKDYA